MKKILFFLCVLLCAAGLLTAASAEARLPGGLQRIGEEAFAGTAMETMELPGTVLSIGRGAFADMPNLKEILFTGPARVFTGRGMVRLDATGFPAPSGAVSAEWAVPGALPSGNGAGPAEEKAEPAGEAGEEPRDTPRGITAARDRSDKRPRDGAAFHPLDLCFP